MVKFVNQINDNTCVHACLSMVTGKPIEYFVERFGDIALGLDEIYVSLVEHKIFPQKTTGGVHDFPFVGYYLVACPSKNLVGKTHQLVVKAMEDRFIVFDPQNGREGKDFWTGDDIITGEMGRTEVLYLDYDILKDMKV